MTKILRVSLCAIVALWASTGAAAQTVDYSHNASARAERVTPVKTVQSADRVTVKRDVKSVKTKPIVRVVRRSVPRQSQTLRASNNGFVILSPETVTDEMTIYRSSSQKTSTPNLYKQ